MRGLYTFYFYFPIIVQRVIIMMLFLIEDILGDFLYMKW